MVTRRAREAFHNEGATLRIRCQTDLFRNALNLVKQGMGVTLVDPFTVATDPQQGYVLRRFTPRILLDVIIVTARGRPISAIGAQFLEQVSASMAALAAPETDRLEG